MLEYEMTKKKKKIKRIFFKKDKKNVKILWNKKNINFMLWNIFRNKSQTVIRKENEQTKN